MDTLPPPPPPKKIVPHNESLLNGFRSGVGNPQFWLTRTPADVSHALNGAITSLPPPCLYSTGATLPLPFYLPAYPCCSHLEHRVTMKRFVSHQFLNFRQSVGLLGRGSARRKASTNTGQHKHRINAHRHPCLESDPNPRYQCSSGRRHFMP
jgi:hypothetical protein